MADWKFDDTDFDDPTLNVVSCRVSKNAGAKDSASLEFALDGTATAPAAVNDDIDIKDPSGNVFFRGIVTVCRPPIGADSENWIVEMEGGAFALEEIPLEQERACLPATSGGPVVMKPDSTCILGWDASGARQNTAGIISDIIDYAATQSSGVTAGSILSSVDITVPQMEVTDVMCMEAINSVLRWHPDAVLYFEHSAGTLNVVRPGAMGTETRVMSGDTSKCEFCDAAPRVIRKVEGVQIYWRITSTLDAEEHVDTVIDSAGDTTGRRRIAITIPLQGTQTVTQTQEIETLDIPPDAASVTADWLMAKFDQLKKTGIVLTGGSEYAKVLSITQEVLSDEETGPGTTLSTYPRELIKGSVQPWMSGISACPVIVTVKLAYIADQDANPKLYDLFKGNEKTVEFAFRCMGTDATDREYTTSATQPGETPPTGLAADYYDALNTDWPEGTVVFNDTEVDTALKPGKRLTLTGAVTMTTGLIQSVDYDIFAGRTTVRVGPAGRLAPNDLVELARAGSRSRPLANSDGTHRTSSAPGGSGGAKIKGATGGRQTDTHVLPAAKILRPFEVTMVSVTDGGTTGSVKVAEGWLNSGLPGTVDPGGTYGPQPERYIDYIHVVNSSGISCSHGDYIWAKVNYTNGGYTLPAADDGPWDIGVTLVVTDLSIQAEFRYADSIDHEGYLAQPTRPAGSKGSEFYDYVPIAKISIVDGLMTITQIQIGPLVAPIWSMPNNLVFAMSEAD